MRSSLPPAPESASHGEAHSSPGAQDGAPEPRPSRIGSRYELQAELGRGGMAVVYRVLDVVTGRQLALKRLMQSGSERRVREIVAAFEREYHTLVQLSHPRIIEVYDFGGDEDGPYYTMELLDGGDLRERAPLPWRQACALIYDVCSSLALLHSRRLVHRDVSPRNVRTTRDGKAKLIDFGAMVPMGAGGRVVGTPAFVPPEVLHRSTLDARTDLFSLGATLYFALTARLAYGARDFAQLQRAWEQRPAPPSAVVADIPAALDALVMSLISLDAAARPRSAFDVMQRVAAIAQLDRAEADEVSQAYLSTPTVVGRDALLADLGGQIARAATGQGASLLLRGAAGVGRTRMLDACALEAKIAGAVVLRVNARSEAGGPLAIVRSLAAQLGEAFPDLARGGDPETAPEALTQALTQIAGRAGLAILIDDLPDADEASLAWLAALAPEAARRSLILLATAETGGPSQSSAAFAVFANACRSFELAPLSREDTELLLGSVFGDVANLALLSERTYEAAAGNPRETLDILQTLIARGAIRYHAGQWLLPGDLDPGEIPSGAAEACHRRVAELSKLARQLAELHALASHPGFRRNDYAVLAPGVSPAEVDAAISELVSSGILAGDGDAYALSRREWAPALDAAMTEDTRATHHRALAELYGGDESFAVECVHHLLAGGRDVAALDRLRELITRADGQSQGILPLTTMSAAWVADLLERALTRAEQLGRSPAEVHRLLGGVMAIAVLTDERYYYRAAPALLAQFRRDSGLDAYERLTDVADPNERLMRALTEAARRYQATPPDQRVCDPQAAIKGLALFSPMSIAIGSRAQDHALIGSLPSQLEPFAGLSPLLHALWQNALATRESMCDNLPEQAQRRWREVDAALAKVSAADLPYLTALRGAIWYAIASIEVRMGVASAEERVRVLDGDPAQRGSAMSLRRIARLHRGDLAGAERFRKQAELLSLHGNVRQMFTSTLPTVLVAHAMANDLTGIRESLETIAPLAERFPGWVAFRHLGEGYFEQARGHFEAARQAFERGLAVAEPDAGDPGRCTAAWLRLEAAYIETLVSLDRAEEARARGERVLACCAQHGIGLAASTVRRALAVAEGKLGDYPCAAARLQAVVDELKAYDIRGVELGATYEARARIAIWASDDEASERYGRLTAEEYRYGQNSPLGARYERLLDEARTSGVTALPEFSDIQTVLVTSAWRNALSLDSVVSLKLDGASSARERAQRGLQLLCDARAVTSGHLFLYTEQGLTQVASCGESSVDGSAQVGSALRDFVTGYVTKQFETDEQATVVETAGTGATSCWRDERGVAHDAILLIAETEQGRKLCLGAAILECATRNAATAWRPQLVDALGHYLLAKGDARGFEAVGL